MTNAAANAAAKAKWNTEMAMIKQSQSRRASFHVEQQKQTASEDVLLPTPAQQSVTTFSAASSSTYAAPEPAVATPAAAPAAASSAVETKLAEGTQTQDRTIDRTAPSTSVGSSSRNIVADKGKTEAKQDVVSVAADVRTSRSSGGKGIEATAGTSTRPIPGAETGVIRPSVVDAIESALEKLQAPPSSSDASLGKDDNEGKEDVKGKPLEIAADASALDQGLNKEEKPSDTIEEVDAVPGAESGVIRPNMIDALGSMLSKLELVKQIRKRAQHDTEMLKELGTALTATGAIATFFTMKK